MLAALVKEFGPPESVVVEDTADPVPGHGQVLLDVVATSVNFPDLLVVDGTYQNLPERPFSPGKEAAGRIAAVGDGVKDFAVGDRVLALVEYGGYAEKLVVEESHVVAVPDGVGLVDAAALGLVYTTAWFGLVQRARLEPGETVLVTGAGGGVGSAGIEIAKALGGTVIALARDAERAELCRALGADHVLTSTADTLRDDIMGLTSGRGVDVTLESVGGDILSQSLRATAWEGRVIVTGFASGSQNMIKPGHLLVKNISVMGLQSSDYRDRTPELVRAALTKMLEMADTGQLNPPVAATYSLDQTVNALRRVGEGKLLGKVVITTNALGGEINAGRSTANIEGWE